MSFDIYVNVRTRVALSIVQQASHCIWGHQASVSGGHKIPVIDWMKDKLFWFGGGSPWSRVVFKSWGVPWLLPEAPWSKSSLSLLGLPVPAYSLPELVSRLSVFILQVRNLSASPPWCVTLLSPLWSYIPFRRFLSVLEKWPIFFWGYRSLAFYFPYLPYLGRLLSLGWFSFCAPPPRMVSLSPAASSDHAVGTPPSIY